MTAAATDKIMTLTEIEERFHSEWILVEDPELDPSNNVVKGRVLFHSKDRDEVDAIAMRLRPKHSAFLYTGPTPDNVLINL